MDIIYRRALCFTLARFLCLCVCASMYEWFFLCAFSTRVKARSWNTHTHTYYYTYRHTKVWEFLCVTLAHVEILFTYPKVKFFCMVWKIAFHRADLLREKFQVVEVDGCKNYLSIICGTDAYMRVCMCFFLGLWDRVVFAFGSWQKIYYLEGSRRDLRCAPAEEVKNSKLMGAINQCGLGLFWKDWGVCLQSSAGCRSGWYMKVIYTHICIHYTVS